MPSTRSGTNAPSGGCERTPAPRPARRCRNAWALPTLLLLLAALLSVGGLDVLDRTTLAPVGPSATTTQTEDAGTSPTGGWASSHDAWTPGVQRATPGPPDQPTPSIAESDFDSADLTVPAARDDADFPPAPPAPPPAAPTTISLPLDLPVTVTIEVPVLGVSVDTRPRWDVVGQQAMDQLRYVDISGLGWRVDFHDGRDGYLGIADPARHVVDIWIRDDHQVIDVLGTLAHELTHVLDYERFTDEIRSIWMVMRGLDTWWPPCTCDDRDYGAGDIAEAMVILEAGMAEWTGRNGVPTADQLAWLASIVA